jgi:hypothetical protein
MKTGITIAMVLLLGLSAPAWAKCVKDGVTYQTGARVGPRR